MRGAELMRLLEIGEPDAVKAARPVRRGAVRKGLADDTTRRRRKGLRNYRYLACRLLYTASDDSASNLSSLILLVKSFIY